MGFWDNVLVELDYLGKTNKWLAEKAGFDASNIGRGIKLGSSPSADTAVKIANVLNVSVEYLVTGKAYAKEIRVLETGLESAKIQCLHKYAKVLDSLERIPEKYRKPILKAIEEIGKES